MHQTIHHHPIPSPQVIHKSTAPVFFWVTFLKWFYIHVQLFWFIIKSFIYELVGDSKCTLIPTLIKSYGWCLRTWFPFFSFFHLILWFWAFFFHGLLFPFASILALGHFSYGHLYFPFDLYILTCHFCICSLFLGLKVLSFFSSQALVFLQAPIFVFSGPWFGVSLPKISFFYFPFKYPPAFCLDFMVASSIM